MKFIKNKINFKINGSKILLPSTVFTLTGAPKFTNATTFYSITAPPTESIPFSS